MTGADWTARELEVDIGPVAHGGHCVARHEGRVVFVRHALPGERVIARVTEDRGGSFCRADAVEVLQASPDRVEQPCPHARPGRCGGCDWQHATPAAQRLLKASVVSEQLARLGGRPDVEVTVEAIPGGSLGWRTRVRFAVSETGAVGLHRHRSREVEPVERCPLGIAAVDEVGVTRRQWPQASEIEVIASSGGDRAIIVTPTAGAAVVVPDLDVDDVAVLQGRPRGGPPARLRGHRAVREQALGRAFRVGAGGFWQVHPAAAETLAVAVVQALSPHPGDSVLDLYAGVGLFAAALADHVGPGGRLTLVESDGQAARDAAYNLRDVAPRVTVETGLAAAVLARMAAMAVDLVVLDPPRAGAGAKVVGLIVGCRPRAVAYVACDPAALGRDVATFARLGYRLDRVRAFDLFPMTHHVECVALFVPSDARKPPE